MTGRRTRIHTPGTLTENLPELVARFERESVVGSHVSHPCVCQATDFGTLEDGSRYLVALQRKIAFPFVTVIMTLLAVPFAVTTGRRGALYGIGVGIVIAIVYWVALSVFGAFGTGGVLPPTLAAWAPNLLFGAVAAYLVLTVRT